MDGCGCVCLCVEEESVGKGGGQEGILWVLIQQTLRECWVFPTMNV